MRVIISGGTGFIGQALVNALIQKRHEVFLLTRNPHKAHQLFSGKEKKESDFLKILAWDAETLNPSLETVFRSADALIHLGGAPVACYWTKSAKERIFLSRIKSTRTLANALIQINPHPSFFVSASAVGYYGSHPNKTFTEEDPPGKGFLAETCVAWEKEALRVQSHGIGCALLRFGIVLDKGGGALAKMLPPFQLGLGGPLGSGKQWMSWIHRKDAIEAIVYILENQFQGPFNLTAPNPVPMETFAKVLAATLRRPALFRVPSFLLELLGGEMAKEMLLSGAKVLPKRLLQQGWNFKYPTLEEALGAIFSQPV